MNGEITLGLVIGWLLCSLIVWLLWHADHDPGTDDWRVVAALCACGPFTLIVGACVRFADWFDRHWDS